MIAYRPVERFLLLLAVICCLVPAAAAAQEKGVGATRSLAPYLNSPELLQRGLGQLLKRTGPSPVVSQISIEPERITLLTQGQRAAYHTDR